MTFRLPSAHYCKRREKNGILRDMTVCSGYVSLGWREPKALAVLNSLLWPRVPLLQRTSTATFTPSVLLEIHKKCPRKRRDQRWVSAAKGAALGMELGGHFWPSACHQLVLQPGRASSRKAEGSACAPCSWVLTRRTARVGWFPGSIASELPQQEVTRGEGREVHKGHNQSNKLNAHHYVLSALHRLMIQDFIKLIISCIIKGIRCYGRQERIRGSRSYKSEL